MTRSRLLPGALLAIGLAAISIAVAMNGVAGPSNSDLALIDGVIKLVQRDYVHPIGSDQLTKDALKGMLSRLDPHSDYMDEQELKEIQGDMSGKFGGLGIEISQQGGIPKVISAIDDTPAAHAGLQPGDLIVAIDGKSSQGVSLQEVVSVLRGKPGTTVKLTISRGTKAPFEVTLSRSIIHLQSVKSRLEPNGIGYLRITQFGEDTPRGLSMAIDRFRQESGGKLKGLVLDLRDDPGGLLSSAVAVASNFLDGGAVVSVRGRQRREDQAYRAPAKGDALHGAPIVVLINGASASASEIVAGALQDHHRAIIMGTRSFGKGSVQTIIPLNGHGALRLTTALYFTPAGRSIQGKGIAPDVVVEAPKDEQVEGAVLMREDTLRGAFANPGGGAPVKPEKGEKQGEDSTETAYSPPIRADLIGAATDGQLKAALSYLAEHQQ